MAPLLFSGLRGVNISSCASPSSTSIFSNKDNGIRSSPTQILKDINRGIFPHKSKSQRNDKRKGCASENVIDRPPSTIFLNQTSSSSRFLLGDEDDHSYSSSFELYPDFEEDPVPDLIKIDPSRFHFGERSGSLDLRSTSASFCRPEKQLHQLNPVQNDRLISINSSISKTLIENNNWEIFDERRSTDPDVSSVKNDQKQIIGLRAFTSSLSPEKDEIANCSQAVQIQKSAVVVGGGKEEKIPLVVSNDSTSSSRFRSARRDDPTPVLNSSRTKDKVVVLKVSLHCKGCEGKVRKHLSRMKGVTSFSIDFPAKKVTVVGDVTPLAVLSSISKVKNAQLWSSPP